MACWTSDLAYPGGQGGLNLLEGSVCMRLGKIYNAVVKTGDAGDAGLGKGRMGKVPVKGTGTGTPAYRYLVMLSVPAFAGAGCSGFETMFLVPTQCGRMMMGRGGLGVVASLYERCSR